MFKSPKARPECFSLWQISQLAARAPNQLSRAEQAHFGSCESCAKAWRAETEALAQARLEPLPTYLKQRLLFGPGKAPTADNDTSSKRSSFVWSWLGLGGVGLAAAAALLIMIAPAPNGSGERIKGRAEVHLAVMRADKLVFDDVPLAQAVPLLDGDRLRLRVLTVQRWFSLWAKTAEGWQIFDQGTVPKDGWLPTGLRHDVKAQSNLRLLLCPRKPATEPDPSAKSKGCERVDFAL